jgi:hypothetical protein
MSCFFLLANSHLLNASLDLVFGGRNCNTAVGSEGDVELEQRRGGLGDANNDLVQLLFKGLLRQATSEAVTERNLC